MAMFRNFKAYRPLQVARFVKTLFKGQIHIEGVGTFDFDEGKILMPSLENKRMLSVMSEVNQHIRQLSLMPA
ncbi:hypothetical protein A6E04_18010 [Aliivibrio logei]|jgi:hypothetical protein|uniref:DUF1107 domain-containing protein n=3 Tax=Aliivibrio TaxID=511678 RepID=A0A1B9NV17_ALILO|nr:hypothetical protein A6E04_18010 [Aliivibrio logei]OEF10126.1 hypothetical protein A1Q5_13335 [Aliivibrio logei 5S-186]